MQFPKDITTTVGFRYIGDVHANKYGKHLGIDNGKIWEKGSNPTSKLGLGANPRIKKYNELTKTTAGDALMETVQSNG